MTTRAEREQAIAKSIADAITFAQERGHVPGPFTRQAPRYVAAQAICIRCGGEIVVDTKGVIGIPKACV